MIPLLAELLAWLGMAGAGAVDLADPVNRGLWLSHPVIGDVSYDTFTRSPQNPIYTGKPPYEWPVNGSLFRDPATGDLYCYVGLYPKGYLPFGPAAALRSRDQGRTWDDLGIILHGDAKTFDGDGRQAGAMPDVTVVAGPDGYHMVYDWAKPDNSDGGLGYAFARSPAGPWIRDAKPIHAESAQPMIPPGYKRIYAGALVRRQHDWLVLASMSAPRNAGGMWADVCMTAASPHGPWSAPIFLRKPQDASWLPQPIEFFPAFTHDGYVYAAHTSVALNRGYQLIHRAPIEDAHRPQSWSVWQAGSLFHAEAIPTEAQGIWGQAFGGMVDPAGLFWVMYPARKADGVGTINIASRPWGKPMGSGFWLSGPNGPSLGLIQRSFRNFTLNAELRPSGPWRVIWNQRGPLGPDRSTADATLSPLTWHACTSLAVSNDRVQLKQIDAQGDESTSYDRPRDAPPADGLVRLAIRQAHQSLAITLDGRPIGPLSGAAPGGAIGLVADKGTCIHVKRFQIDSTGEPSTTFWLPLEGLLNAGDTGRNWTKAADHFRFGIGYTATFDGARAKWNFAGKKVRLWAPRGPSYGMARVLMDQVEMGTVDLHAPSQAQSSAVWESEELSPGLHALMVVRGSGTLPVDCIEVIGN